MGTQPSCLQACATVAVGTLAFLPVLYTHGEMGICSVLVTVSQRKKETEGLEEDVKILRNTLHLSPRTNLSCAESPPPPHCMLPNWLVCHSCSSLGPTSDGSALHQSSTTCVLLPIHMTLTSTMAGPVPYPSSSSIWTCV